MPAAQDLKVLAAAGNIGQHMPGCKVIIDKNRVPVGTAELVQAAVVITEWRQFKNPDFDLIRAALREPLVCDGSNLFDPELMRSLGIENRAIGRAASARRCGGADVAAGLGCTLGTLRVTL